jgi:FkbM family methyltransferase
VRIFIDVGAHYGETLEVALDPAWAFDRIFALEPSTSCQSLLCRFRDARLSVEQVALGAETTTKTLYGAGLLGASLYASKRQIAAQSDIHTEEIPVVRASDWLRDKVPETAEVYMKLNCEGAECDILDDLLSEELADRLTSIYIDFDVRKVDGQAHRQVATEQLLKQKNVLYATSESVGRGGNPAVVQWLERDCPRRGRPKLMARLRYDLGLGVPFYLRLKRLARFLLPARSFNWLGHRLGRMSRT